MLPATVGGAGRLQLSGKANAGRADHRYRRAGARGTGLLLVGACVAWLGLPASAEDASEVVARTTPNVVVDVASEPARPPARATLPPVSAPAARAPGPAAPAEPGPSDAPGPAPTAGNPDEAAASLDSAEGWMEDQVVAVEDALREAQFRSAQGISAQLRFHPSANDAQRVRLEHVHAIATFALGDEAGARASFQRLLRLDPGFAPGDDHSPKVRRAFEEARQIPALQ